MEKIYQSCFKRKFALEEKVLLLAFWVFSYPRLLLEVFLRKNFGERYFSMGVAILIFIVLAALPLWLGPQLHALSIINDRDLMRMHDISSTKFSYWRFILKHITWYLFLGAFIYFAYKRECEVRQMSADHNYKQFTFYTGDIHPTFWDITWKGKKIDQYKIETIVEPLVFFVAGFILIIFHQFLGYLLVISSIAYSASYRIAYYQGENLMADIMDIEKISKHLETDLSVEKSTKDTEGFHLHGRRPADPAIQRKIVKAIRDNDSADVK